MTKVKMRNFDDELMMSGACQLLETACAFAHQLSFVHYFVFFTFCASILDFLAGALSEGAMTERFLLT